MPFIYFLLSKFSQQNWSGTFNHKNYKIVFDDVQAIRICNIFFEKQLVCTWKRGYKDCFNFLEIYENIPRELLATVRAGICKKFPNIEVFNLLANPITKKPKLLSKLKTLI